MDSQYKKQKVIIVLLACCQAINYLYQQIVFGIKD